MFRLSFQRAYLSRQLRQNIIDTHQILLLIFQFFQCRCFSTLEFNNSGCLIKQFPAFLRFATQNLVNLSLTNNRIAFFTNTGIIKKLIDILQTTLGTVDQILALSGAIHPSCYCHFIIIQR